MSIMYDLAWSVLIYSFIGWCGEVIFAAIVHRKFVNRGFLNGPFCPIYGVGMTAVLACFNFLPLSDNLIVLFIESAVITTVIEFITGLVLDRVFHQKWWDYTGFPMNIMGYVCPPFSLLWGAGCVAVVKLVNPLFEWLVGLIPLPVGRIMLVIAAVLFAADLTVTVIGLRGLPTVLRRLDEAERLLDRISEEIGERLADGTLDIIERSASLRERSQSAAQHARELIERHKSRTHRRIMRAFPNLDKDHRLKNAYEKLREKLRWEDE